MMFYYNFNTVFAVCIYNNLKLNTFIKSLTSWVTVVIESALKYIDAH